MAAAKSILWFPDDLVSDEGQFPKIVFTVQAPPVEGRMYTSVWLPMPSSISFNDGGNYSTIELGPLAGSGLMDALGQATRGDFQGAKGSAKGVLDQITAHKAGIGTKAVEAGVILADKIPLVNKLGKEKAMFAAKKITAPNTNTTFSGNTIREFNFDFKFMARTRAETETMRDLHRLFRRYIYAGSDSGSPNIILDYPPVWKIQFILDGDENPYLPRIFGTYLKTFTSTFNPNAPFFRDDGSPLEIDVRMAFQETRVLTRADIDALDIGASNRGISETTGLAISSVPASITGIPSSRN